MMGDLSEKQLKMNEIIWLLIIGLGAGILSGMVGIGGGIVLVPALVMLLHFNQHQAQGTVLAMLMFPVVALGVLNYYKGGFVDFKVAILLGLGFVLGSWLGSKLAVQTPEFWLKKVFGVIILLISLKMIFSK
jgi:uncharacterized membrane protein YfcA